MKSTMHISTSQRGFTIIEMLVAMAMALVIMAAVTSVFISTSDSNRRLQGLAEVQDNARFAINFMKDVFQGAAYSGCMTTKTMVNNQLTSPNNYSNDFTIPMVGYESTGAAVWSPALDPTITAALPLSGSDIVTVRGAVGPAVGVQAGMAGVNAPVPISTNHYYAATNPVLLVSNCGGFADIFQKTNTAAGTAAHAAGPNSSANLSRIYSPGDIVVPVDTTTFFIRLNPQGINSLYALQGTAPVMEMVRGVDGMQILYGVTTTPLANTSADISANQFLTAQQVGAGGWGGVVSVRIGLLLSTPDPVTRQPDTAVYTVLGTPYGPFNDLRLRRQFETTVSLRNRSLQ